MKTSLPIRAVGPTITRFAPGDCQPEHSHVSEPAAVGARRRSVIQWRFIDSVAARIDEPALPEARAAKAASRAHQLVYAALGT